MESVTFDEAVDEFMLDCEVGNLSDETIRTYKEVLDAFGRDQGDLRLAAVDVSVMRGYMASLWRRNKRGEISPHTVGKHDRHLRVFWRFCEDCGFVERSPMRGLRRPKLPEIKPSGVPHRDIIRLLEACNQMDDQVEAARNKAIILWFVDTGCRRGGAVGLTLDDIDLRRKMARVTEKGDKTRPVFFSYYTAQHIRQWLAVRKSGSRAVFTSVRTGEPLKKSGFNQMIKRMKARAGVRSRISPQRFRNSFSRQFLRAGGDISVLSRLLGHSDIKTTHDYYAVFDEDELQELHAEAGVLDSILRGRDLE